MADSRHPAVFKAPVWQEAVSFAARAHRHQIRKDGRTPYFAHVCRVAFTVSHVFECRDDLAVALALLHDTIEDTTTDYDDLEDRFGPDVARGVASLTKNMALPEPEREAEYDARLARADWRVKLVKLADTYDNYCDALTLPPELVEERRADSRRKAERAIALAESHRPAEEVLARGVLRLREALAG